MGRMESFLFSCSSMLFFCSAVSWDRGVPSVRPWLAWCIAVLCHFVDALPAAQSHCRCTTLSALQSTDFGQHTSTICQGRVPRSTSSCPDFCLYQHGVAEWTGRRRHGRAECIV